MPDEIKLINPKYRIRLKGKYWKGINTCPHCYDQPEPSVIAHIVGFANSDLGVMAVVECPVCFKFWNFHARILEENNFYTMFVNQIQKGFYQKHF